MSENTDNGPKQSDTYVILTAATSEDLADQVNEVMAEQFLTPVGGPIRVVEQWETIPLPDGSFRYIVAAECYKQAMWDGEFRTREN